MHDGSLTTLDAVVGSWKASPAPDSRCVDGLRCNDSSPVVLELLRPRRDDARIGPRITRCSLAIYAPAHQPLESGTAVAYRVAGHQTPE
jgi:hypothetical protein